MSKESFKSFARSHTELASYVMSGKTNWQKLYELYEIYGENSSVWKDYFSSTSSTSSSHDFSSLKDLMDYLKNLDLDGVQKSIVNMQKAIGLIQNIGGNFSSNSVKSSSGYSYLDD